MTPDEDRRLSASLDSLQNRNATLKTERDAAREEVRQLKLKNQTLLSGLRDIHDLVEHYL